MANVRELKKKLKKQEKEILGLKEDKEELKKEIQDLKKELLLYKNSNTPSSANKHLKPNTQGLKAKVNGKRGAPKGHKGTNRPKKESTNTREIHATKCPNCQNTDIDVIGQKHQQIEEVPVPVEPEIIDVVRDICRCKKCNLKFVATDKETPLQGKFGINLMMIVILIKFMVRGVLRKTTGFLEASLLFKLAPATVQAIIWRVAKAGETEYEILKHKIRKARLLYIDETSFSVLGKNWWVWIFRSDTDILLVIRGSRGNNVLEEILGKMYSGTVICDCWRAYDFLSFAWIQRCWAHLLRKSKDLCSTVAGRHFHEALTELFAEIKKFNSKERTQQQRDRKYIRMTEKLKKLIGYYSKYEECKSVIKYIDNHFEQWFTCIKIPGIEPTNNYAEQAIRETVMVRKIIGAFRSETGVKVYETLASLFATWQFQKRDLKQELYRIISTNLC